MSSAAHRACRLPAPIAADRHRPSLNPTPPKQHSFKNGLCQLPVYRKPWEHVISAMAGAAVFEYVAASEETMVRKIEERYADLAGAKKQ
jgi:hypothetical protein